MNVANATEFGRVAVMFGGPAEKTMTEFIAAAFDRVWIALHGPGGEDGALQGLLQWLDVPYTGSGVMASAIAMDKVRSKHLFRAAGIPTPDYAVVKTLGEASVAAEQVGFPLIIKPSGQGSSVGMSKVFAREELNEAVEVALQYGDTVLLETCVSGEEFTVAILQGRALPSIRISTPRVFYDYRAKYESDRTEYICRGTSTDEEEAAYAELAIAAFNELGCSGWGRVDFMTGADKQPLVLEVNTVPGMTSHSLVPMAAREDGVSFEDLCWRILETSMVKEAAHGA